MSETFIKNFMIEIQQKLYETQTPHGHLAVYQTSPFGKMLTMDNQVLIAESDSFFYYEMMTHPALFTHPSPKKIAVIGNPYGILQEVIKHPTIQKIDCINNNRIQDEIIAEYFPYQQQPDSRITYHTQSPQEWLTQCKENDYDIIIQTEPSEEFLENYAHLLPVDGLLIYPCLSSILHFKKGKSLYQPIKQAGFNAWQLLNFPQPSYQTGWRTVVMSAKRAGFPRIREKAIFNRPFTTRYYNYDVHKAALVLPEFLRKEWELI